MRKSITEAEKLQLLGLVTLARQHYKIVDQVRDAISSIIQEEDSLLHDALWDYDTNFDKSLASMGIKVEDAAA